MKMKLRDKFDEIALLELFCTEPKTANPSDGYWCYEVKDSFGSCLRFDMDVIQESVQLDLKILDITIVKLTFELVDAIEIIDTSTGKFAFAVAPKSEEMQTRVQVELRPQIKIQECILKTN